MPSTRMQELLAPGYLDGLGQWSLDDIHTRRAAATEIETGLSYLRRLVQGRLDIVLAEGRRRARGEPPGDVADLIERLPTILGERVHAPGLGRLPTLLAPGELDEALMGQLDAILPAERLAALPDLDDDALQSASRRLDELERTVSAQRRALHDVLDRLQEELVRRYRTGEATVDSLLP